MNNNKKEHILLMFLIINPPSFGKYLHNNYTVRFLFEQYKNLLIVTIYLFTVNSIIMKLIPRFTQIYDKIYS